MFRRLLQRSWLAALLACAPAEPEPTATDESSSSESGEVGDGDGDAEPGDGDGEPGDGDGDGEPSDGDGELGDGDGDGEPGDGDGDGEPGDGDGDGDGDDSFAEVIGDCDQLAVELEQPTPSLYTVHLDFRDDPYDDPEDLPLLTPGAQTILTHPNAGGSSIVSEAFAYETLALCEAATLLKTETEIDYEPAESKKTDFSVSLAGEVVGVSVTRAVGFPPEDPYPAAQAEALVQGKLEDILISSQNVVPEDAWLKQILVVMAYADMHAELIAAAWMDLDDATRADTIVYVVVTDGIDTPIYFQ